MPRAAAASTRRAMYSLREWWMGAPASSSASSTAPRILLLDGGVSTHLEYKLQQEQEQEQNEKADQATLPISFQYPEIWSSSLLLTPQGRQMILDGHRDWFEAGSHALSTVTYQCHYHTATWPRHCPELQTPEDMNDLWQQGIALAVQAAQEQRHKNHANNNKDPDFVIASSGCFGAALANGAEYTGDYGPSQTIDTLMAFHQGKLDAIQRCGGGDDGGVDGIAIETVPSLLECQALAQLCSDQNSNNNDDDNASLPPIWISLACRNDSELNDGTPLPQALDVLETIPQNVLPAIGLNCCDSLHLPALVQTLLRHVWERSTPATSSGASPRGLVLYPNSGEVWDNATQTWQHGTGCTTPNEMATRLFALVEQMDASWDAWCRETSHTNPRRPRLLVGGCCRTTPATIAGLRTRLEDYLQNQNDDS
eukprot:CAMPEP_0172452506 /NCGR_PEP_ID=MMETSP1065-20121228/10150_1 /TAXON_ID=265537 /ORGANISM="Amphiprora paludosa, Strain CCMP125" /LENGTH=424 /DNA_ID=CAMNT_0013204571 /DNA_START=103 /DNA_END=1377 /DNA_ORIENTATION=+